MRRISIGNNCRIKNTIIGSDIRPALCRKESLAEKLAEYAIECGYNDSTSVVEGFAEQLLDGFIDGNKVKMDDTEIEAMNADYINFIEDMLVPEADQLIIEWNRDAREEYEEREEARRGQY